ncbi:MAG TPA: sensor histidine kinase [Vicinamibacteria bacterium]|nr:sensor histidine kinase [Vicinamibacteria bacterium]
MKVRTWGIVAVALGGLLLLLGASLLATRRRVQEISTQLDAINLRHREVEGTLRRLRGDFHVSGIFVRDYLLDTSRSASPEYREELSELRAHTGTNLAALERLVPGGETPRIQRLKSKIDDYWEVFDPVFDWTPFEKSARSLTFVRREVIPRRDEVLKIAQEIEDLNDSNMRDQRAQVALGEAELRGTLDKILLGSLGLGALVALVAVFRIRGLEMRSQEQHERTERAEDEMRRLSQRLVRAQEDERRRLARELHDEVGQMLTALRMELGTAERVRGGGNGAFSASLAEAKKIIDTVMESVRALSMGLRPAMLDDFGLGSALDWHARDYSRRYDVPVFLAVEGDVDRLPEPQRTCVYRVVQEALTNCAKHSRARRIDVAVREGSGRLHLSITDDGVGVDGSEEPRTGMGLVGIEERVREIGGHASIHSRPGAGTRVEVDIPVPPPGGGDHESPAG